eukprot:TRINITY_DN5943_c0_g2_i2.p1 TRINITY_DN5943_c0_g2~~TRINITY_DN5943_c0_g2_i2.p1  ORF type:complete len:522 (-),score=20.83 TRINITY_DN5943_c0_g2_i2:148-1500(-)
MSPLALPSLAAAADASADPPRRLSSSCVAPAPEDAASAGSLAVVAAHAPAALGVSAATAVLTGNLSSTTSPATSASSEGSVSTNLLAASARDGGVAAAAAGKGAAEGRGGSKGKAGQGVVLTASYKGTRRYANSWFRELVILTRRAALMICRNPALYGLRLSLLTVAGLLLSSLFWQPPHDPKGLYERLAYLSFIVAVLFFSSADATPIFIQDRNIFIRETSHNTYRTSTYVIATALVYTPLQLLMAFVITLESWWCVGLSGDAFDFCYMFLLCFCCLLTGNAIATFISAFFKNVILAYAVVISINAYFTIISGFYIHRDAIPTFWIWLHYLSPIKYAYEGLVLNEFDRINANCYLTLRQTVRMKPVEKYVNVTRAEAAFDVFLPAILTPEAGHVTEDSCLLYGERIYGDLLAITQMTKWECLAVLFSMAICIRIGYFLVLTTIYKAKRK